MVRTAGRETDRIPSMAPNFRCRRLCLPRSWHGQGKALLGAAKKHKVNLMMLGRPVAQHVGGSLSEGFSECPR